MLFHTKVIMTTVRPSIVIGAAHWLWHTPVPFYWPLQSCIFPMNILAEDTLLYADDFFSDLGNLRRFSHQTVTPEQVADADILLVRSTTRVNEALLSQNQRLKFVGTGTAGSNHFDKAYLNQRGIPFVDAAGCNAIAVAEYVVSALLVVAQQRDCRVDELRVGIVGAGHVGTALSQKLRALCVDHVLCDPPLQDAGDPRELVSLDTVMECDVISLHTPLIEDGKYPTRYMFNAARLAALQPHQWLINACRGEVLDNAAALSLLEQGATLNLILDVWENEPAISQPLLDMIALGTAHIAGHTLEGKARGTEFLYQKLCAFLHLPIEKTLEQVLPPPHQPRISMQTDLSAEQQILAAVHGCYDVHSDDKILRKAPVDAARFAYIRKHYAIRREFSALQVSAGNRSATRAIYELGFLPPTTP